MPPESTPTPTDTPRPRVAGVPFDRVVSVVDMGADPSGNDAVGPAVEAALDHEAGTLVRFPGGTYRLDSPITVEFDRVGFIADGDATVRLDGSFTYFLRADGVDEFVWKGIDVDMSGDRQGGMRLHAPRKFHVEDVEYLGRGGLTGYAFNVAVHQDDGKGTIENVVIKKGGHMDRYDNKDGSRGDGRIGIWAGERHHGTLEVRNVDFREFGNNGMYTSRNLGNVRVYDSYFENNNVSGVRISGDGSFVENTTFVIDHDRYPLEISSTVSGFNTRPIIVEQGKNLSSDEFPAKPAGCEVRDCTVKVLSTYDDRHIQSAIDQGPQARSLTVRDTEIRVDVPGVPAVWRHEPGGLAWRTDQRVPPEPHWTKLEGVKITGTADTGEAVYIQEADGTEIRNTCINQANGDRTGIRFENTRDALVENTNINVEGDAIAFRGSDVTTRGVREDARHVCDSLLYET